MVTILHDYFRIFPYILHEIIRNIKELEKNEGFNKRLTETVTR